MMNGIVNRHRGGFRLLAHPYKRRHRDPSHSLDVYFCHGNALEGACRQVAGCRQFESVVLLVSDKTLGQTIVVVDCHL